MNEPTQHTLKRTGTLIRVDGDRRRRPLTSYICTCGAHMVGDSRRQARRGHFAHRYVFAAKA